MSISTRVRALLAESWALAPVRRGFLAMVLVGPVAAFIPLAGHLGYEFAALLALVAVPASTAIGLGLMNRRLSQGRAGLRTTGEAMALASAGVVAAALLMALVGLVRPACEPGRGLLLVGLLAWPSALLSAGLGALARRYAGTLGRGTGLSAAILATSLGTSLWPLYAGPSFFAYDPFFGYFPGPLYDESVFIDGPLLAFRALTLVWTGLLLLAAHAGDKEGRRASRLGWATAVLALALLAASPWLGEALGYRASDARTARLLGGERRVDGLELHYPAEWSPREVERFVADARFQASEVASALRIQPSHTVRVWMYRSAEEKRRLTGAGATSFTKPWRHEVHVHASGLPHPVLRHELVHAFGAEIAGGPFGVPGGLFPSSPLVEGFAVAFDDEPDELTVAQWARSMHDRGLAPDVGVLLSASGFLSAAPARAYTYAGAFLRDLRDRFGLPAVLDLYRHGDLSRLGEPSELVAAFEQRLATVAVGPEELAAAERRYSGRGLAQRACGRESARLVDEAHTRSARHDAAGAVALLSEACALDPDDPALLRSMLDAALDAGDRARAAAAEQRLFAHPRLDPSLEARALMDLGRAAWRQGDVPAARGFFERASRTKVDTTTHRQAVVHARAAADAGLAALVKPLLLDGRSDAGVLFELQDGILARPEDALLPYLLGRQFVQQEAPARGAQLLAARSIGRLSDVALEREAVRLAVRGFAEAGRCDAAEELDRSETRFEADAAQAATWVRRCRFAQALPTP